MLNEEVVVIVVETGADVEVDIDEVVDRDVDVELLAEEPPVKRYGPITSARICVGTMLLKNGRTGV